MSQQNSPNRLANFGIGLAVIAFAIYSSVFTVDQTEYAIKIRLGKAVEVYDSPGLKFKVPFITKIFFVDNRLLTYDSEPGSVFTKDKKQMVVDHFSRWKVKEPLKFYETVRNVGNAQSRLHDVVHSQLREALGKHNLSEIIAGNRELIMDDVTMASRKEAAQFGVHIVDVRIKRADLPESNSRAVYGRMEAERRRDALRYRSEGSEMALKLKSKANREKVEILAEAEKQAEEIRGDAEAKATRIYASAYSKDIEFFQFLKSHDAYRKVLQDDTTILLSSERDFFKHLK